MASLKLTPWHEGTFASSVIYSPPPPPASPHVLLPCPPLVSNPVSLLPQIDIHYLIVKQESFFSCSPGTQKNGGGENKIQYSKTQPQVGLVSQGGNLSSSLVTLGPGWKWQCVALWRHECDGVSGEIQLHERPGLLGQDRETGLSVRISTCSNQRRTESLLRSLTDKHQLLPSECR